MKNHDDSRRELYQQRFIQRARRVHKWRVGRLPKEDVLFKVPVSIRVSTESLIGLVSCAAEKSRSDSSFTCSLSQKLGITYTRQGVPPDVKAVHTVQKRYRRLHGGYMSQTRKNPATYSIAGFLLPLRV